MKIKKGDTVIMTRGKDRNKKGKVIRAIPKENKVVIEGLNLVKKHSKPRKQGEKGQIISIPRTVFMSNTKLICPRCNMAVKIGYSAVDFTSAKTKKKKQRICKKCKGVID